MQVIRTKASAFVEDVYPREEGTIMNLTIDQLMAELQRLKEAGVSDSAEVEVFDTKKEDWVSYKTSYLRVEGQVVRRCN